MPYVIFGNYGNATLALIQWAYEQALNDVTVVHAETGWAAEDWAAHVSKAQALVSDYGFNIHSLKGPKGFADFVKNRRSFPNNQFQWCPNLLKGLPLLMWLDNIDPACEATIILGKRRSASRANFQLPEFIEESVHYGGRQVWYPLYVHNEADFFSLITRTGFEILAHRSLECEPCIHNTALDFQRLRPAALARTAALEEQIGSPMFAEPIKEVVRHYQKISLKASIDVFDMGCGSPFACGE